MTPTGAPCRRSASRARSNVDGARTQSPTAAIGLVAPPGGCCGPAARYAARPRAAIPTRSPQRGRAPAGAFASQMQNARWAIAPLRVSEREHHGWYMWASRCFPRRGLIVVVQAILRRLATGERVRRDGVVIRHPADYSPRGRRNLLVGPGARGSPGPREPGTWCLPVRVASHLGRVAPCEGGCVRARRWRFAG